MNAKPALFHLQFISLPPRCPFQQTRRRQAKVKPQSPDNDKSKISSSAPRSSVHSKPSARFEESFLLAPRPPVTAAALGHSPALPLTLDKLIFCSQIKTRRADAGAAASAVPARLRQRKTLQRQTQEHFSGHINRFRLCFCFRSSISQLRGEAICKYNGQ